MADADSQGAGLANSPARQLLAALNRASQEMEKSVSDACAFVASLNFELEKSIKASLDKTADKIENIVCTQLESAGRDKDLILTQLAELRQEELKVLQSTAKELRAALEQKLNDLLSKFRKNIDQQIESFQSELSKTNSDAAAQIEEIRKRLKEQLPIYLEQIRSEYQSELEKLEKLQSNYQATISSDSVSSLSELSEHQNDLRTRLENEGEEFLKLVSEKSEELSKEQTARLEQRMQFFAEMEKAAGQRIEAVSADDLAYLRDLPEKFRESCKEMADLQVGLHANAAANLALQYRTEVLSASQGAEDQLQIARDEMQNLLKQYQSQYIKDLEQILVKFKSSAQELADMNPLENKNDRGSSEQIKLVLTEQLEKIRQSTATTVKDEVVRAEGVMDEFYEEFKQRLEAARKEACERLEHSFQRNQQELAGMQQQDEQHLQELSQRLSELEQSISEARELISALDQASLDF